jgi:methylmalonyl-CoA mutase cobalamin-binding subunit
MTYKIVKGANDQDVTLFQIGGRSVEIDIEIADLVDALNKAGFETVASCSGQGVKPGIISLKDGRELVIARDYAEARRIDRLWRPVEAAQKEAADVKQ